jgi:predicted enzyme related to lactoylglutathione lyase
MVTQYAIKIGPGEFGIFDAFPKDAGPQCPPDWGNRERVDGAGRRIICGSSAARKSGDPHEHTLKRLSARFQESYEPHRLARRNHEQKENHMSQTVSSFKQQKYDAGVTRVAMNLEVDVIPVSDVERSKQFYQLLGWRLDSDDAPVKNVRIVQFTAPGSGCSVTFGNGLTAASPGSAAAALIVSDIEAAHVELIRRGINASEMWHGAPFPPEARLPGPDPKRTSYGSFFSFNDPDGNTWLVQEVTTRHPGRI